MQQPELSELWKPELFEIWDYLFDCHKLGEVVEIHRGFSGIDNQNEVECFDKSGEDCFSLLSNADDLRQFDINPLADLKTRAIRENAWYSQWNKAKVIFNKTFVSDGAWKLTAVADKKGLFCSSQFLGIWPKMPGRYDVISLAAILNSPLANAFVDIHTTGYDVSIPVMKAIPIPSRLNLFVIRQQVQAYLKLRVQDDLRNDNALEKALKSIDAEILRAYDLPPKLERLLLDYFNGENRPVDHEFGDYYPSDLMAWIPLHEYLSEGYQKLKGDWVQEVFKPLNETEIGILRNYLP